MGTEPRKGTPEGDRFDGKVWMATAVAVFLLCLVLGVPLVAVLGGGVTFVIGALKYHAGLVRQKD